MTPQQHNDYIEQAWENAANGNDTPGEMRAAEQILELYAQAANRTLIRGLVLFITTMLCLTVIGITALLRVT